MRTILLLTVATAMLAWDAPVLADQAVDEAAIRKATEQRDAAANAKDAKLYLAFIDEDCTAGWNGNPCAGAVRESGEFPEMWKNARTRIFEGGDIVFVTPEVAIHRYSLHRSGFLDANGKLLPPGNSQAVMVYVKKDGQWLLAAGGLTRPID